MFWQLFIYLIIIYTFLFLSPHSELCVLILSCKRMRFSERRFRAVYGCQALKKPLCPLGAVDKCCNSGCNHHTFTSEDGSNLTNMNRYLPVARQHFLTALASTSVVVKCLCATVFVLYLVSWLADTRVALGITPGYLFPPNFWIWTLLTHAVVEQHVWDLALNVATVMVAGRLLEPLWGALELLVFFVVVNIAAGLLSGLSYVFAYAATFDLGYLFDVHISGAPTFLCAVLVALKQTSGDTTVLRVPQVRLKAAPALVLLALAILRLAGLLESSAPLVGCSYGALAGWVYLRFYQRHSRGRGDMSDHFAFASFFPEALQPAVGLIASLVHAALVKIKVCRKMVKRYDVGAPSSITISLPGTDPQDAERRRQLALKALNERLKRVEDQSAWPSMEDEEDDDEIRTDAPLLPTSDSSPSAPNTTQNSTGQETSIISFEDAPAHS